MRRHWIFVPAVVGMAALHACADPSGPAAPVFTVQPVVFTVAPSGDIQGIADADNIEAALDAAKASGGVVFLTDGDPSTVDHYYTSRNVVTTGFSGTLRGEGMANTVIHAGRRSPNPGDGFAPAFNPWWSAAGSATNELATVLQFDVSAGDVTIADLSIEAQDDSPTDLILDYYGHTASYITTFIEILGGEHDTWIENVRLTGKESGATGNRYGMNVDVGLHVMLGSPSSMGRGDLFIKNVEVTNVISGVLFMRYEQGSTIVVDGVQVRNVGTGIWSEAIVNSFAKISNSEIALRAGGWEGIFLFGIASGLEVTDNTITGRGVGLAAIFSSNATIAGNTFRDFNADYWPAAALLLWGSHGNNVSRNAFDNLSGGMAGIRLASGSSGNTVDHNDFGTSNLPGWTNTSPAGPGAVLLDADTHDNLVFEMKFPAQTSKTLCQMVWDMTDDPLTTAYDGVNVIQNWRPCESLAKRDARAAASQPAPVVWRKHF